MLENIARGLKDLIIGFCSLRGFLVRHQKLLQLDMSSSPVASFCPRELACWRR